MSPFAGYGTMRARSATRLAKNLVPALLRVMISWNVSPLSINQYMEGWLCYEFIGGWSLLWVPSVAGGAAAARGDRQVDAVPCDSGTVGNHRSIGSHPFPEEPGGEKPAVQGSCPRGGCEHRDLREQSFHRRNQTTLVLQCVALAFPAGSVLILKSEMSFYFEMHYSFSFKRSKSK